MVTLMMSFRSDPYLPLKESRYPAVLLNCEPVSEEDPTLLPIPNHVMLNHLYALSISDGVMVMGATSRFSQVCHSAKCSTGVPLWRLYVTHKYPFQIYVLVKQGHWFVSLKIAYQCPFKSCL